MGKERKINKKRRGAKSAAEAREHGRHDGRDVVRENRAQPLLARVLARRLGQRLDEENRVERQLHARGMRLTDNDGPTPRLRHKRTHQQVDFLALEQGHVRVPPQQVFRGRALDRPFHGGRDGARAKRNAVYM